MLKSKKFNEKFGIINITANFKILSTAEHQGEFICMCIKFAKQ